MKVQLVADRRLNMLTARQQQVLDFILTQRIPPSVREIGRALGIRSTNGVCEHLRLLRQKGVLEPAVKGLSRTTRAKQPRPRLTFAGTIDSATGRVTLNPATDRRS